MDNVEDSKEKEPSKKADVNVDLLCEWTVKAVNVETGEVVQEETHKNVVVNTGKGQMLNRSI